MGISNIGAGYLSFKQTKGSQQLDTFFDRFQNITELAFLNLLLP
jgi:hypothetical protein